jgi:hypothetical protein
MTAFVRKMLLVIGLTVLIWVWADQALTREAIVPATISVDKSTDQQLLVSFDFQPVALVRLKVSGPASKIDTLERRLREGSLRLEFFLNPVDEKIATAGVHSLQLLPFVQKSRAIADLGLRVESIEPETINVNVIQLAYSAGD